MLVIPLDMIPVLQSCPRVHGLTFVVLFDFSPENHTPTWLYMYVQMHGFAEPVGTSLKTSEGNDTSLVRTLVRFT